MNTLIMFYTNDTIIILIKKLIGINVTWKKRRQMCHINSSINLCISHMKELGGES